MQFTYEILPRPVELGGGWRLRLLEDDVEVGGGVFPPSEFADNETDALQRARFDAEDEAYAWLDSRETAPADLNAQELHRRRAAIEFALANVGLSGFTISEAEQDRMRRFVDGGMSLDEFVKGLPGHTKGEA
jgi:hypothetical protein